MNPTDIAIASLKSRIDTRLNNILCEMKEGYDDSITGFNEAWDAVTAIFNEEADLAPSLCPQAEGGETQITDAMVDAASAAYDALARATAAEAEVSRLRGALTPFIRSIYDHKAFKAEILKNKDWARLIECFRDGRDALVALASKEPQG